LVRAQKTFGISVATAENLQSSLLNERGITDLLTTVLYEESGIVHDAKVRQEFFLLAGRTLVQTSARLKTLEASQKKQLAQFIAFAFEQCPQEKLPTVIMRVWEATKGDAKQLPSILASILTGLGPAFVKFGQRLATSNIDADYKRACRQLSSENTEVDSTLFYHNTEAIFGTPTFDSERSGHKLGEGSMAAAFTAVPLGSDKLVAIKIIQPAIESEIESDCVFIQKLVEYINTNKPFGLLTLPANTANKIRQQLKHQIDTEREIANSKALSSALSSGTAMVNFRVPEVDEQFSPRGVIVSEYLPGYELDKHEIDQQGYKSTTLRNEVGLEAMRLLLTAPVYQSDVNYGNFGALKDPATGEIVLSDGRPTVIWYDAGAVEQISIDDQKLLLTIIKSAMTDPSLLPQQLCRLVKNSEEGSAILADICQDFKNEWAGGRSFAPSILKERFERFFDKVSERGLEVEERWLIVANTISMAAPLLEGVSSDRLKELIVDALNHHDMLSFTERVALSARSWFS
jgi:predicted unusual protein kinase regulating ubiquinone biosynthesis (AarF/ABC1/UbiB family)